MGTEDGESDGSRVFMNDGMRATAFVFEGEGIGDMSDVNTLLRCLVRLVSYKVRHIMS